MPASMAKRKINVCFACGDIQNTTEHHVKELTESDDQITVELCRNCHVTLNHYQEEAIPRLKEFLDGEKKP